MARISKFTGREDVKNFQRELNRSRSAGQMKMPLLSPETRKSRAGILKFIITKKNRNGKSGTSVPPMELMSMECKSEMILSRSLRCEGFRHSGWEIRRNYLLC